MFLFLYWFNFPSVELVLVLCRFDRVVLLFIMFKLTFFDEDCCCIWTSSTRHFNCVHVFRILLFKLHLICYEEFIAHFTHDGLRNYQSWRLWILCFWFFGCAIFLVQSKLRKKKKKIHLVLVQMVPHFHIRECIPWLCVNLPQKKTQICIFFVYWGEVNFLLNVLIENIISLWCTIFIRWPCRKLASWPFDSCFLLDCGSYWLLVRIVNQVDVGWQIVQQSPHASVLS